MRAALQLFEHLEIEFIPSSEAQRRGPRSTCCGLFVERLIRKHGLPHITIVLRTIVESEGNEGELIADVIGAISDTIRKHPRWVGLGLQWLEAFDQISLAQVRKTAKSTGVQPLRDAIMTLLCVELAKILGPSRPPKPPKPIKVKSPPKPPRSLTRSPEVQKNVALGLELVALRSTIRGNRAFGRQVRARYDIDAQLASESMKVARLYGGRDEIITRLSWDCLRRLAATSMPATARQAIEAKVIAGEKIVASDIDRARQAHAARPTNQPATRMAA
jgi:hypothetical protein